MIYKALYWIYTKLCLVLDSFIFQPLRGGNGVVSIEELAKYTLIVLTVYVTEHLVSSGEFTATEYGILIGSVIGIAGIQMYFNNKNKKDELGD